MSDKPAAHYHKIRHFTNYGVISYELLDEERGPYLPERFLASWKIEKEQLRIDWLAMFDQNPGLSKYKEKFVKRKPQILIKQKSDL